MEFRGRRRAGALALVAFVTSSVGLGLAGCSTATTTQNDCPRGLVNDPYPGACREYVDTNGDNICDLSQTLQQSNGGCPLEPCVVCGICSALG